MISGPVLFAWNLENYWGHAVQPELHEQPDGRFMPTVPSGSPFSLIKGADKPITLDEVKEIVRGEGDVWYSANVKFTRTQSEYHATYQYPQYSRGEGKTAHIHLLPPGGYWSAWTSESN